MSDSFITHALPDPAQLLPLLTSEAISLHVKQLSSDLRNPIPPFGLWSDSLSSRWYIFEIKCISSFPGPLSKAVLKSYLSCLPPLTANADPVRTEELHADRGVAGCECRDPEEEGRGEGETTPKEVGSATGCCCCCRRCSWWCWCCCQRTSRGMPFTYSNLNQQSIYALLFCPITHSHEISLW